MEKRRIYVDLKKGRTRIADKNENRKEYKIIKSKAPERECYRGDHHPSRPFR